ncbi:MAG: hypothetical protein HPY59_12440 [Anaerolineae bacterium]|nr:hypothetical protein [Anaerolineae bacterium]
MEHSLTKHDVVQIKPGVIDLKSGFDLGGWQGRIYDFFDDEDGNLVAYMRWDSQTIKTMPDEFRRYCIDNRLSWVDILIGTENLTPATPRDTIDEADWERARTQSIYLWSHLGESGKKVCSIFDAFPSNEGSVLQAWEKYLKQHLSLPFSATLKKRERFSARGSSKCIVHDLNGSDEIYGIAALVEINHQRIVLPITDIHAPRGSKNYDTLANYKFWFTNQ